MLAVTPSFFFSMPLSLGLARINGAAAAAVAARGEDITSCPMVRTEVGCSAEVGSSAEEEEERRKSRRVTGCHRVCGVITLKKLPQLWWIFTNHKHLTTKFQVWSSELGF
jgi:hypothetical protein